MQRHQNVKKKKRLHNYFYCRNYVFSPFLNFLMAFSINTYYYEMKQNEVPVLYHFISRHNGWPTDTMAIVVCIQT